MVPGPALQANVFKKKQEEYVKNERAVAQINILVRFTSDQINKL